jgi:aspartyl-tRNA(Asn)/glutamyl-tRNA(Gln) amidotransferase subunit C
MTLSREEVRRVAALARLQLSAAEEERFAAQLGRVVEYIDQLERFETAPVESPAVDPGAARDVPEPSLDLAAVLANAPRAYGPFVTVPRVLETDG